MVESVRIAAYGLRWLEPESEYDLCAHGRAEVRLDDELFIATSDGELALSTAALHLLRTVASTHTADSPVAEHLIPCCGHFMYLDDMGRAVNLGCPYGVNWWVRHDDGIVVLNREDGVERRVGSEAWARAVGAFSDQIRAFYQASPPREFSGEDDALWYRAVQEEWNALRAKIPA